MKKIRDVEKEFRLPRSIITICLLVLIIAYIVCFTVQGGDISSILCAIIAIAAGLFLMTLGIVIKRMDRRVDLDYDSTVTWKLCVVAGILVTTFGVFCIIMSLT